MAVKRLFPLGQLVMTRGIEAALSLPQILQAVGRHMRGDWGTVGAQDRASNDQAVTEGTRIFSAYQTPDSVAFWVITEADRASTTVLLPDEY